MKFGQPEENKTYTWIIPPDHPGFNLPGVPHRTPFIYVGCGKWDIDDWVGPYYATGTKPSGYLKAYLELFNSIEVNNTFYRLSRSSMVSWAAQAEGTNFLFCPKWSQRVTNLKRLKEVEENTQYFIDSCQLLGSHLGPTLLQLPDNFTAKDMDRVRVFLELIPAGFEIFFEFRHKSWFEEPVISELGHMLKTNRQGLAITDVAARRDVLHMVNTIPKVFIRFNGYDLSVDHDRLEMWASRIKAWFMQGLEQVYFFCHHQNELHSPENAIYMQKLLNEKSYPHHE